MTSRAVCYRIELAAAKTFMTGVASQIPQLDIQAILPKFLCVFFFFLFCFVLFFYSCFIFFIFFVENIVIRHTFIQVDLWPFIFPRCRPQ